MHSEPGAFNKLEMSMILRSQYEMIITFMRIADQRS